MLWIANVYAKDNLKAFYLSWFSMQALLCFFFVFLLFSLLSLLFSLWFLCFRFDNRLKRPKFESRQDSQHFHQQQQLQHNSHFSQHPQNSSSNKQPSKPCTSQPPRDPYEFTDDESSVFGTLPARNFRTSRDDLFRSSPIKVSFISKATSPPAKLQYNLFLSFLTTVKKKSEDVI